MKITKRQLRRIIKEELATINREVIDDEVMRVLSDEGGAAGEEPIADALEDLEDDEISLPDEPISDIIDAVPGVKRHKDGDFVDTTQLEVRNSFKALVEKLVTEVSGQIICPNCGHKNSAGVDKCSKCGHPRDKGNWKEA